VYATCHALTSGSSSVLPVSLTVVLPEDAGDDAEADGVVEDELELLQAASKASGTTAAAVHTKRILLPTGEISFAPAHVARALFITHAGACVGGPHKRAGLVGFPVGRVLPPPGRVAS
jgi:hypothetical protein